MLGLVDVQVTVGGGGPSGQAGAIRYDLHPDTLLARFEGMA